MQDALFLVFTLFLFLLMFGYVRGCDRLR